VRAGSSPTEGLYNGPEVGIDYARTAWRRRREVGCLPAAGPGVAWPARLRSGEAGHDLRRRLTTRPRTKPERGTEVLGSPEVVLPRGQVPVESDERVGFRCGRHVRRAKSGDEFLGGRGQAVASQSTGVGGTTAPSPEPGPPPGWGAVPPPSAGDDTDEAVTGLRRLRIASATSLPQGGHELRACRDPRLGRRSGRVARGHSAAAVARHPGPPTTTPTRWITLLQ
jgi:hypothetical protein